MMQDNKPSNKGKKNEKKSYATLVWLLIILFGLNFFFFSFFGEGDNEDKIISVYIDSLPYYVDEKYVDAIREGTFYWEQREGVVFRETSSELEADVRVQWVKEFGGEHIGYAYGEEFIEIGIGDSLCREKWRPYNYEYVLQVVKHELGHVIGKEHINDSQDIMYPQITKFRKYEIELNESDVVVDGWLVPYRLCTLNEVAEYSIEIISDEPINVYIVESIEEYNKLVEDEKFIHYPECQETETKFYKKTCTISSESIIVLENPTEYGLDDPAYFTIVTKEL